MHEAYQFSQLISRAPYQIESMAAYDSFLLIGSKQGSLMKFRLDQNDDNYGLVLLGCYKEFSKKPIQQLEVISEYNLLFSLSDGVIQVNDLNSADLRVIYIENETKGSVHFTINLQKMKSMTGETQSAVWLCAAVKRKLQLYYWKTPKLHHFKDINLSEIPKAISWNQDAICVGFRGEYCLYSATDGTPKPLFPTSSTKSTDPCIIKVNDNLFGLQRDSQTVFVTVTGETETKKSLKWSDVPVAIAWDEPYALGILQDAVEVQTVESKEAVQTIGDLNKVRLITRCKQGLLVVASVSHVWCVWAQDVAKQRDSLLQSRQFQLALKLTSISNESEEDKAQITHQIQTLLAYDLFKNKKFTESMTEFSKLDIDPFDVIRLFPNLLPQQNDTTETVNNLDDKDMEAALLALIIYLTDKRFKLLDQAHGNNNASGNLGNQTVLTTSLQQRLEIIDTTLLKCYLETNDALVAPLLRRNHCHLAEAERTLKKHNKQNELIILYNTKGKHRRALELLQSEKKVEGTIQYLQRLGSENMGLVLEFADWVLETAPEEGLKIFTEDIAEVEALPRPRVLDFLLRRHIPSVIPYLEHVVHTWEDTNPLFHNALVHQYREKVIKDPTAYATRTKLLRFLEDSPNYIPDTVLSHFPADELLEERAIIVGRLGKHELALFIYVRALGDIEKAISYCKKIVQMNLPGSKDVFVTLIKLILNPKSSEITLPGVTLSPKTAEPDLEKALQLLKEFSEDIDPLPALQILPDNISVCRIYEFLQVVLHKALEKRRNVQLLKGLLYAQHLQCQEKRLQLQSQSILVTELNVCCLCKKRFGNLSALVLNPNGEVVHYSCNEKKLRF